MAAYRLLALTYIARDHDIQAKEAVKRLLESAPNYNPDDAIDPQSFRNLVAESRGGGVSAGCLNPIGHPAIIDFN